MEGRSLMANPLNLTREQWQITIILLVSALLCMLNLTLCTPCFPAIMADFSVSSTDVQGLASGYAMVEAIIIPLNAYLIGRFSTRQLFFTGFLLFIAGSLLIAWSPTFEVLMAGRVLQAACTGIFMPMMFTLVLLIFPIERRGVAMGFVTLVMGFAPIAGPVVAGLLIDSIGWRVMFLGVAIAGAIILIIGAALMTNYGNFERITFDKVSVVYSTIGMFCVLFALSSFTSTTNYLLVGAMFLIGVVFVTLFLKRQKKLEYPMLRIEVLEAKPYAISIIVGILANTTLVGIGIILPIYIQSVRGFSATISGLVTLPGALAGAIMAPISGNIFDKHGARKMVILGGIILVIGGALLSFLGVDSSLWLAVAGYFCVAFAYQCMCNPLNTWGINSLPNNRIQHANAFANTTLTTGISFMTALMVSLSALSLYILPYGTALQQGALGSRIAFIASTIFFLISLTVGFIYVHDVDKDKAGEQR